MIYHAVYVMVDSHQDKQSHRDDSPSDGPLLIHTQQKQWSNIPNIYIEYVQPQIFTSPSPPPHR